MIRGICLRIVKELNSNIFSIEFLQVALLGNRLTGPPLGLSILGCFVVTRETALTVRNNPHQ